MKTQNRYTFLGGCLAVAACAWMATPALAQNVSYKFTNANEVTPWTVYWGGAATTMQYDTNVDFANDATSGSMKVTVNWDAAAHGDDNQFSLQRQLPRALDGTKYTNLMMDVKVDPSSPLTPWGDHGYLELGVRNSDWLKQNYFAHANLPNADGWVHLEAAVPLDDPIINDVAGLTFKMWAGPSGANLTGTMVFWVDNIKFTAIPQLIQQRFDDAAEANPGWSHWWGAAGWNREWDPTVDVDGDTTSGSMKVTINFDKIAHGGDNQFSFLHDLTTLPVDGTQYTNIMMDVLMDPTSPQRPWGDFGYLEFGIRHSDWSGDYFCNTNLPTSDGWIHVEAVVPATHDRIDDIAGLSFKMWSGDAGWGQTGTYTFWVDNVKLVPKGDVPPPPPPTLVMERNKVSGLRVFATQDAAQYQRQSIRTVNPAYSWLSSTVGPMTYSMTIADFPDKSMSGFQAHMFLVPGNLANTVTAPDWTEPNCVFVQIAGYADGSAGIQFMYKTNEPNGNTMIWGPGNLGNQWSPTPLGTWSVAFDIVNMTITLASPNNTTKVLTMPQELVDMFANPVYAYFGIQPNEFRNIGGSAVFSRIQITGDEGAITPIDETFSAPLDPNTWELCAEDKAAVVYVPADALYWITWALPANGYKLQTSADLKAWADSTLTPIPVAGTRKVLFSQPDLPGPDGGYFRLFKP